MKASQKRFIARILTISMALISFLLIDSALSGALSLAGAICLIPASLFITNVLWQLSLRKVKRARLRTGCNAGQAAKALPAPGLPPLYVVSGGTCQEDHTKPPHVA